MMTDEYIKREDALSAQNKSMNLAECRKRLERLPAADVRPAVQREALMQALSKFFTIGDSYTYELNRVKEAFYIGTMTLDDFEEWNEDNVSELCDYLMKKLFCDNCGAKMDGDGEC